MVTENPAKMINQLEEKVGEGADTMEQEKWVADAVNSDHRRERKIMQTSHQFSDSNCW